MTAPGSPTPLDDPIARVLLALAVAPTGLGGAVLSCRPGPARRAWLELLRELRGDHLPWRKIPLGVSQERLLGGLDLARTLSSGRRTTSSGLLAETDGGTLVLPSAERCSADVVGPLLEVLDRGRLTIEREGISARIRSKCTMIAIDESLPEEDGVPAALLDRLAFHIRLPDRWLPPAPDHRAQIAARVLRARKGMSELEVTDEDLTHLTRCAAEGEIHSLRPLIMSVATARAFAALEGRTRLHDEDLWWASVLVLTPRGAPIQETAPQSEDSSAIEGESDGPRDGGPPDAEPPPPLDPGTDEPVRDAPLSSGAGMPDQVVAAVRALLPASLGEGSRAPGRRIRARGFGRGSGLVPAGDRGRRIGDEPGMPGRGRRLDLTATLRAAAPWQALRSTAPSTGPRPIRIQPRDLRIQRRVRPVSRRTVFLVDASGSQALRRLGEVKGAVELLLADSYRSREEVALAVFRDRAARRLVPPTRSLTRVKRLLRGLPGGGGTPLASALALGLDMAVEAWRDGVEPRIILLSDGRPNVDARGRGGRHRACADALALGAAFRLRGIDVLVLDTSPRGESFLAELAGTMGTESRHLPFADSGAIRHAVGSRNSASSGVSSASHRSGGSGG